MSKYFNKYSRYNQDEEELIGSSNPYSKYNTGAKSESAYMQGYDSANWWQRKRDKDTRLFGVESAPYRGANTYMMDNQQVSDYANELGIEVPKKRSALNRFFDVINIGAYTSAGIARGFADGKGGRTPLQGAIEGIKAGNPFGKGFEEGEHTYSEVLGDAGWNPESFGGKAGKFAVGLAGDIFLDPMTYMSLGMLPAIKGTGSVVAKIGGKEIVEGLTYKMAKEALEGTTSKMTMEMADDIVRRTNKTLGIADSTGRKGLHVFGKTLIEDKALREFGDKTIAPYTNAVLDKLKMNKYVHKVSHQTELYSAFKDSPQELARYYRFMDILDGRSSKMADEIMEIGDYARHLKTLKPDQQKALRKIIEDPDMWKNITEKGKFSDTDMAMSMRAKMTKAIMNTDDGTYQAVWRAKEGDIPVEIIDELGEYGGRRYVKIKGSDSGIPWDEIDFEKTEKHMDNVWGMYKDVRKGDLDHVKSTAQFMKASFLNKDLSKSDLNKTIHAINKNFFGGDKVLDEGLPQFVIEDVLNYLAKDDVHNLMRKIEGNPFRYRGISQDVYSYLGKKYHYGKDGRFKNFQEIQDKLNETAGEAQQNLAKIIANRNDELALLRHLPDEEIKKYLSEIANKDLGVEVNEDMFSKYYEKARKYFAQTPESERFMKNRKSYAGLDDGGMKSDWTKSSDKIVDDAKKAFDKKKEADAFDRMMKALDPNYKKLLGKNGTGDGMDDLIGMMEEQASKGKLPKKQVEDWIDWLRRGDDVTPDLIAKSKGLNYDDYHKTTFDALDDAINAKDPKFRLSKKKYDEYSKALDDDVLLESIARRIHGDKAVDEARKQVDTIRMALDASGHPESIKALAKELKGKFNEMGVKEVQAGLLTSKQFDKMQNAYLFHMLTPDAEKLLKADPELSDKLFGGTFHGAALSRKIKKGFEMKGKVLKGNDIDTINEFFKDFMNGNKLFADDISEIYLARATMSKDGLYAKAVDDNILKMFGDDIADFSNIPKGTVPSVNINNLHNIMRKGKKSDEAYQAIEKYFSKEILESGQKFFKITDEQMFTELADAGIPVKALNEVMYNKANMAFTMQQATDTNLLLKAWDRFTQLYKINVVTVPGTQMRNVYSNQFQNWLSIGSKTFSPKYQAHATNIVRFMLKGGDDATVKLNGKIYHYSDLVTIANRYGIMDEGMYAKEIGESGKGFLSYIDNQMGTKKYAKYYKFDPTDVEANVMYKASKNIGNAFENQGRMVNWLAHLDEGMSLQEATDQVQKFLFDYGDVTPFEQSFMKRVIPFYTWARKNIPLQLERMMVDPNKYRTVGKIGKAIEDLTPDEEKMDKTYLNDFAHDWFQLPIKVVNEEGRLEPMMWNPNMPYMDVAKFIDLINPATSAKEIFTQMNPGIKVPIEIGMNRNMFFDAPLDKMYNDSSSPALQYVLDSIPTAKFFRDKADKKGLDLAFNYLNSVGGVKVASYDYDTYKRWMLEERIKKLREEQKSELTKRR